MRGGGRRERKFGCAERERSSRGMRVYGSAVGFLSALTLFKRCIRVSNMDTGDGTPTNKRDWLVLPCSRGTLVPSPPTRLTD